MLYWTDLSRSVEHPNHIENILFFKNCVYFGAFFHPLLDKLEEKRDIRTQIRCDNICKHEKLRVSSPDWLKSGAGLKAVVGERGERLCVGDPGRLSPEERERFREEKLRLVWSRGEGCMAKRRNTDRRLGNRKRHAQVSTRVKCIPQRQPRRKHSENRESQAEMNNICYVVNGEWGIIQYCRF